MLLAEIATRLTAQSLVPAGWVVYQGFLPDAPDKVIVLYATGGTGPERFLNNSPTVEQPGLQVVTRGVAQDATTPATTIQAIYQALVGWGGFVASGVRYLGLTALQAPFISMRDGQERVHYSVNFLVQKEFSP